MDALFVGLGGVGQRHLRNLYSILGDRLNVSAYRERGLSHVLTDTLEIAPTLDLDKHYGINVYDNLSEALARKPDAVFICNPTSMHIPVALEAAKKGCHLFIEKALSHSFDGVSELIDIIESKKLTAMVAYQMRFHPCLKALHDMMNSGAIGRILSMSAEVGEYMPNWHKYEDYRQMYASRKDLGGGVIISQIHEFDYIQWLLGTPKRIFAMGGHLSSLEIDVEDTASISMEIHKDGNLIPVHLHQDYLQRPPTRTCKVIGDTGKVEVDFMALTVTHYGHDGAIVALKDFSGFERNQLFLDEMSHFLACMASGEKPCVTVRDGAQSLAMALAAKESITTGRILDFEGFNKK